MIRTAVSYHAPLAADLDRQRRGKVLSAHKQAVNLALQGGQIISLVTPTVGNGPAALVIEGPLVWAQGDFVRVGGGIIVGPGLTVALQGAVSWSPVPAPDRAQGTIPWAQILLAALEDLGRRGSPGGILPAAQAAMGRRVFRPDGMAGILYDMGLQGITLLAAGDYSGGARRLAGLGPGLTPSGDDLLGGFVCLLRRAGSPIAERVAQVLGSLPDSASPPLSRHLLAWAAKGVAGAHHLAWLDALLAGTPEQFHLLESVLAHGASSGTDWAAGALLALNHLVRNPT